MFNNLSLPSLASIAREKLHGTATPGAKDDARLYRWVLLKNSLTNALSRSSDTPPPPTEVTPPMNKAAQQPAQTSSIDDVDAFLFPDGDVFADVVEDVIPVVRQNSKDELESEARWLDSLLESLGDDEADADALVSVVPVEQEEEEYEDSDLASLLDLPSCEDLPSTSLSTSPESILLPPSPPFNPVDYESSPLHIHTFQAVYGSTPPPVTRLTYGVSDLCDDIDALALPDVIEDSSSDTDSESLNTPYNRSISSLSDNQNSQFVTPRPSYVRIFNADDDVPVSNLPYPYDFQSHVPLHVIDPFHQEC